MFLKPDFNVKSLFDIDTDKLRELGVKVILFDLDSTVIASKAGHYEENVYNWLCELNKEFQIAVLSNNTNNEYIDKIAKQSCFDVIGNARKPNTKVALIYLSKLGVNPKECAVVGDRPLTDILVGKRLGSITVLVDSITCNTESKPVRLVRWLERLTIIKPKKKLTN